MTLGLGPGTVIDDELRGWWTRQKELGLIFDAVRETATMPPDQIAKAKRVVANAYNATRLPRIALRYYSTLFAMRAPGPGLSLAAQGEQDDPAPKCLQYRHSSDAQ
ncbi:hypothetical protein ON010_g12619 [Phytophthora cinnamomi]|nr:hypothetical protein ON010_g12619 [Phytophthora cinnamomi]